MKHLTTNYQFDLFCSDCIKNGLKSLRFFNQKGIRRVPLFIEETEVNKEINLIKKGDNGDKVTFEKIMNELENNNKNDQTFNFYLYIKGGGKIIYFDYINNYNWCIGLWRDFFDVKKCTKTRDSKKDKI